MTLPFREQTYVEASLCWHRVAIRVADHTALMALGNRPAGWGEANLWIPMGQTNELVVLSCGSSTELSSLCVRNREEYTCLGCVCTRTCTQDGHMCAQVRRQTLRNQFSPSLMDPAPAIRFAGKCLYPTELAHCLCLLSTLKLEQKQSCFPVQRFLKN